MAYKLETWMTKYCNKVWHWSDKTQARCLQMLYGANLTINTFKVVPSMRPKVTRVFYLPGSDHLPANQSTALASIDQSEVAELWSHLSGLAQLLKWGCRLIVVLSAHSRPGLLVSNTLSLSVNLSGSWYSSGVCNKTEAHPAPGWHCAFL